MGLLDRGYRNDPDRAASVHALPRRAPRPTAGPAAWWRPWALWLAIIAVGYAVAHGLLNWRDRLPFPPTGAVHWYVDVPPGIPTAPLTLEAPSGQANFAVRLDDLVSGAPVAMVPVRGGEVANLSLPLGRYRMTVAKGLVWLGPGRAFALPTRVIRGDHPLDFHRVGDTLQGHRIVLERLDGNMPTSPAAW